MPYLWQSPVSCLNCHFQVQDNVITSDLDPQVSLIEASIHLAPMISNDLLLNEHNARILFRIVE